ncbi:T9SS type A sorting domain-containing protein [Dyadobacter sp. LJ53]|uniref:T9SS type A sorting domain-containing protein n=1 Tax=Dyadobacter chenwenxiniae TaxID=2906456 RepID=UPI001F1D6ED9|nr:T9SS type A sorting domain-containing protein [Dyadobacter chenwenxiniae]MCF0050169.1 T9SS type A sorting domain-containing protein [Dyadobacter chenwenxiniae]
MRIYYRNSKSSFDHRKRIILTLLLTLFQCQLLYAQLKLVPIDGSSADEGAETQSTLRTEATLNLPFFDDFSTAKTASPDTKNWLPGSGVYINNTLSNSQPSLNIATFDGLNATGTPYNLVNPLTQNFTDTLTSQPINLAGRKAADSLYISFQWMAKGLGELPDSSDYLQLEFLSKSSGWVTAWQQVGYKLDTIYKKQFVKIADAAYFHDAFQFRFRAYGRNSGYYDTWHLDYVYLDVKRSVRQPYVFDVAVRKAVSPFLKRYTAMPLRQYRANPQAAVSDSVKTDVVNNFNNFNILTSTFTIRDAVKGTELFRNQQRSIYVEALKSKSLAVKTSPLNVSSNLDSLKLTIKFLITTTDTIPGVNLKTNDSITSRVDLTDYYAYDDGSAEYGVQVNQKLGRVAVQYTLAKPDTIGGIRLAMVQFNKDVSGQGFTIQIFDSKNGKPDKLIAQRSVGARYPAQRNGFIDYAFSTPVAVPDTFYVGWLQLNEQPVTVGFDRNSMLGKNVVFYNLGTEWAKETALKGSIMIRPYLGKKATGIVTGNETAPSNEFHFFPNPNKGIINWANASLKRIEIFSIQGHLVQTIIPNNGQRSATVKLDEGIYIVKSSDGKRSFAQKMLFVQ